MKKRVKKGMSFVAAVLFSAIFLASPISQARAEDHDSPSGGLCDCTYRNYPHVGFSHSFSLSPHLLSNGFYCYRSRLIYLHNVLCSSCNAVLYTNASGECTEEHTRCGTHRAEEPYIGASGN